MTREEIMSLGFEELEKRSAEIAAETADADKEQLETLNAELDAITERRAALQIEIEERKKAADAVAQGAGEIIEERKDEKKMTNLEIRNSHEYIEAFANYVKTGDDMECRTLLSDNVQNGVVPVPEFVGGIVAAALEASPILSRVRRMEAAGNVKMGFEYGAPAAVAHTEGGDAITEEQLLVGIVTLIPQTWKKFVQISDEALDSMSGEAYLTYIYEEVARGIIKAREDAVVAAILAAPSTADATHPSVQYTETSTAAIDDFVQGRALLSSAARDLVIIATPKQYADYRSLQMAASYGVDPFDGLEVLFNDTCTAPIIGDLAGVLENCPKGEAVEFKYDDKTLMTSDIVKILGRLPSAIGVVGDKFFAVIGEEESES
jgi:HK97 family phage major capsid protein